ncbi:DDE superfamily endonuclease [Streptomyces radiopugnans]|uniref:DDE superfamily endonuclease n=1 Tax=Streptomyces radiopugnans TaxID=403935 RepID=A0A1H9KK47_9ACTN|nr:DDE superfamily endonuclease [Streptomyces radiopugnans]
MYLPKTWTEDRERCRAAKVPDDRGFATKGELARCMVLRSLASPLPIAWVTADSAYGQESRFRRLLEQSGLGYVLAVPKSQFTVGCPRIDGLFAQAPAEAWEKISCGHGAKGSRTYHWAAIRLPAVAEFDYQGEVPHRMRWALARRSIGKPDEIAYYLAYAPLETTVQELVRVAGTRWATEECFQAAKNECGLDQYEVRRYPGWYRHITLAMLAHAFLAATAYQVREKGAAPVRQPGAIEFTVAEVRRLLAACRPRPPHLRGHRGRHHALSWSNWRRRRQAVARRCHYLRRCHTIGGRSP